MESGIIGKMPDKGMLRVKIILPKWGRHIMWNYLLVPQPSPQGEGSPLVPQPSPQGEGSPLVPQPSPQGEGSPLDGKRYM